MVLLLRLTFKVVVFGLNTFWFLVAVVSRSLPLAFVFDIDGVLIRGSTAIPVARRALEILDGKNPFDAKIPYLLLTNGGGASESKRAERLSLVLGVDIDARQVIQAHTILQESVDKYRDNAVLVLGGRLNEMREVAEQYGFQQVYTTLDVLAWNPSVWPFRSLSEAEREAARPVDFSQTPISAVLVFHDPRDWALDVQVLCDIVQSGGIIGGPHLPRSNQTANPVDIIFCNPDLIWRTDFPRPRLGQGAFREAFLAVYKGLTGQYYPHTQLGKPSTATYDYASRVLSERWRALYGETASKPTISLPCTICTHEPREDIAGANGAKWPSILVDTGVYDPVEGPPTHAPTHHAGDVEVAVKWAIARESAKRSEA
ncbi:HAD-superfamily hydrolase [Fistulina hepatica ATCC 64428]|uniref:HAD-superfamily hydrolase n=1 Tax=Fistulina hepatica ATCC 64428 TaxID=1128425 RepID=A0A0D7AGY8_9AGAR|nr:HAD-superfamily hydrolase [Fistulina hepatica ATCC 64428]